MKLKLNKPLIVFDLETTGVNVVHDHIVELAYIKVWPDGHEEDRVIRINPGVPIPEASTRVHGITDDDVKDCPTFKDVAHELAGIFKGCGLVELSELFFQPVCVVKDRECVHYHIEDIAPVKFCSEPMVVFFWVM